MTSIIPNHAQTLTDLDGVVDGKEYEVLHLFTKKGNHLFKKKRLIELAEKSNPKSKHIIIKSRFGGLVKEIYIKQGDVLQIGKQIVLIEECMHPTVITNICCDCGSVLETRTGEEQASHTSAHVSMLHSIPDLKVSRKEAERLGREDINNLLINKKLVLLVDLDQTLIHTTNDDIPPTLKDVFHFQLDTNGHWFHTRLRPYTKTFLENISKLYELHICTFGIREYAHHIAHFLDPDQRLFGHRILSRNECLDPMSKKGNLSSLFPCGDNLVCIIDDRSDVWNFAPNVVQVLPYHFFQHTGDINAPPGLEKMEEDESKGNCFPSIEESGVLAKEKTESKDVQAPDTDIDKKESELTEKLPEIDKKESELTEKSSEIEDEPMKIEENSLDSQQTSVTETEKAENESTIDEEPVNKAKSSDMETSKAPSEIRPEIKPSTNEQTEAALNIADQKDVDTNTSQKVEELDVPDNDDYLLYLEDILTKLHTTFYSLHDGVDSSTTPLPDLKNIVTHTRSAVLEGVHMVFSGVIPNNVKLTDSKAYHIALSLGAKVTDTIQSQSKPHPTTHIVAANLHTEKVKQASKMDLKIVTPNWLWCCSERWSWVEEQLFKLEKDITNIKRSPPTHCVVPPRQPTSATVGTPRSTKRTRSMVEEINPLSFLSKNEAKSMEDEVDMMLSDESEPDGKPETADSSDSEDSNNSTNEDSADEQDNRKRRKVAVDEDDETRDGQESENDDELPSVRFRQGGSLPSDHSDEESDEENIDVFGDLLEKMI